MREIRPSGLMRGGKQTVIGFASQSVVFRLLYVISHLINLAPVIPTAYWLSPVNCPPFHRRGDAIFLPLMQKGGTSGTWPGRRVAPIVP